MSCLGEEPRIQSLKIVVVGNSGVGKTSLIFTKTTGRFPEEFVPGNYERQVDLLPDERPVEADLWDTHGMWL